MTSNRPQFSSPLTNDFLGNNKKKKPKKRDPNHERNEAKRAKLQAEDDEEERLTSLIFGGDSGSAWHDDYDSDQNGEYGQDNDVDSVEDNNGALFEIDRTGAGDVGVDSEEEASQRSSGHGDENGSESSEDSESKQKSAWIDEDDENITISLNKSNRTKKLRSSLAEDEVAGSSYEQKLRDRYEATTSATSRTDWATLPHNDNDDGESGSDSDVEGATASKLLSSTASLLTSSRLQPNMLSVKRCPDANIGNYNKSTVQAVQFHPQSDEDEPLMLTAGMDKMLRFFKVNETEGSEKIHSIHFPHLPIHSAAFLGDTGNVVVSGRRPFFYIYDTAAGKLDKIPRIQGRKEKSLEKFATSPDGSLIAFIGNDGYIILVEVKSKMWVADLKMNGSVRAVSFSPDGDFVIASGSDGEVYRFDIRTKKCVDRFRNEDGTISSYISATSRFLAVGAESGVVNFYKDSYRPFEKRSPVKSILNMHTSIDYMKFNPQGDILAMASRREKDSLKLVHVPTQTVFSNWPTSKTPLSYVWSLDFSPGSRFMAVGNDKGKCLLYKLNHYDDN
jgi:U3 small nucleolar RNA-associated protein 18